MRAKFLQEIIDETPKDVVVTVRWYADLTFRINQLLKQKGMSQKDLAIALDKKPSEINKWLKGEHNFTLRSLAKLQVELGEELLHIPKQVANNEGRNSRTNMTVFRNKKKYNPEGFDKYNIYPSKPDKKNQLKPESNAS